MDFLPRHLIDGLRATLSPTGPLPRRKRLTIRTENAVIPVLRRWPGGLALACPKGKDLRGFVDLYEGGRHLSTLLIVASMIEDGELICTVKRDTRVTDHAALDFVRDENAPIALLPRAGA